MNYFIECNSFTIFLCRTLVCENIKLVVCTGVVGVLIAVDFIGIANGYCVLKLHPAINFVLLFSALLLLAWCESLHYAVVSIEKWDMKNPYYQEHFPRAVKCHALVDTPEKVKKFLVGRQFFTIFVVFLLSQLTSFPGIPPNFAGMPRILVTLLVQTGLPGVALTLTFGQLVGQIYAEEFTLPFLNLYGCNFVIRLALAAEYIGICNFSWLLYHIVSKLVCRKVIHAKKVIHSRSTDHLEEGPLSTDDEIMSPTVKIRGPNFDLGLPKGSLTWFDYLKYTWSTCATLGSLFVIFYGIIKGTYVLPVPPTGAFFVAFAGIIILFFLEGLMIAITETQYWDRELWKEYYPFCYFLHSIINQPDNVKRFIIGRQFCTVLTNFLLGQVFTLANFPNPGWNPIIFYIVVKSGFVGVLVTLAFGQLLAELLAAEFPLRFMNMFGSVIIGYLSLVFDAIGVGHAAWTVYFITRNLCCKRHMNKGDQDQDDARTEESEREKPKIVHVNSPEILAKSMKANKAKEPGST